MIKRKITEATRLARSRIWRHNAFGGQARFAEVVLATMLRSDSITPETRRNVEFLLPNVQLLRVQLKTRQD